MSQYNRIKAIVLFSLLCTFCWNIIWGQEVHVKASLDSSQILIGDQMKLHLEITQPATAAVQIPPPNQNIGGFLELIKLIKADTLRSNNQFIITFEYLATSFDSGFFEYPGIPFPYSLNNTNDTVLSNPLQLTVLSLNVDTAKEVLDIKPPINTPLNFDEIWPYTSIILFVAALIIGIWVLYNRKKKKSEAEIIKRKELPHVVALRDLDLLRNKKLWQNNKVKTYYIELTEIIRRYIEDRFGIAALEMTSDEIFEAFKNEHYVDQDSKNLLKDLFTLADLVKFAKAQPLPDENEVNLLNGYQFINNTKIIEVPSENKGDSNTDDSDKSKDI